MGGVVSELIKEVKVSELNNQQSLIIKYIEIGLAHADNLLEDQSSLYVTKKFYAEVEVHADSVRKEITPSLKLPQKPVLKPLLCYLLFKASNRVDLLKTDNSISFHGQEVNYEILKGLASYDLSSVKAMLKKFPKSIEVDLNDEDIKQIEKMNSSNKSLQCYICLLYTSPSPRDS